MARIQYRGSADEVDMMPKRGIWAAARAVGVRASVSAVQAQPFRAK